MARVVAGDSGVATWQQRWQRQRAWLEAIVTAGSSGASLSDGGDGLWWRVKKVGWKRLQKQRMQQQRWQRAWVAGDRFRRGRGALNVFHDREGRGKARELSVEEVEGSSQWVGKVSLLVGADAIVVVHEEDDLVHKGTSAEE
ncbi:hypothetical protein GW17_00029511 [Ensete ventricosum]|nr:hypothetical protein GW17_00029511 [Ensete ventricosum]